MDLPLAGGPAASPGRVEVSPVWLTLVPFEVTEPDAGGDVDVASTWCWRVDVDVDGDVVAFGWAACVGVAVGLAQGVPVTSAVVLPVALVFAVADADAVVLAVLVLVALAVAVLVVVVLSVGLALLAGLALVLLLAGLVAVPAGRALGVADLLALFEGDGEELDGHAGAFVLAWLLGMLLGLTPPADELIGWPIRPRPELRCCCWR